MRSTWRNGWKLVGTLGAAIVVMSLAIAAWHQFDVEGVRAVIRATARTSLLLFSLAFTAAALDRGWPGPATQWLRQNRRYIGVSFAVSHLVHAVAIVTFALADPVLFQQGRTTAGNIIGGLGYVFIIVMAATSFDKTAATLGPRAWKLLHTVGSYYIWTAFTLSFLSRALMNGYYWLFVLLLLIVLGIRLMPYSRKDRAVFGVKKVA